MTIEVSPDEPFHIVLNGHVMALSLEELDAAYQRGQIPEETLIWQEGLIEWMRLDTLLHTLDTQSGPAAPVPPVSEETYYVLVAPEEVKQMSLDLLADAYRLDVIDDQTLVWQPGYTEWIPLAALLGPEESHVSIAPSMPPQAAGLTHADYQSQSGTSNGFSAGLNIPSMEDSLAPSAAWAIPEARKASPWYARSLVAMAALGALFVSYRAGAIESAAQGFEQDALLEQVESKVGEPGTDTTQGLERWLSQLTTAHGLDQLADTDPVPDPEPKSASEKPKAESDKNSPADAEPVEKKPVDDKKAEKTVDEKPGPDSAKAFSSSLSGQPQKVASPPKTTHRAAPKNTSGIKWKGPAGDRNDPMNGSL